MQDLFSIKIRTSKEGKHISGAERIVKKDFINETVLTLLNRQKDRDFDFSNVKIEKIKEKPKIVEKSLKITNKTFSSWEEGKEFALEILKDILKKDKKWIDNFITLLYKGAAPDNNNMRGAMIVSLKGKRIEKDKYKGVRTVLVDYIDRKEVEKQLINHNYTLRTADALALTTKNMMYPSILAEFCISDDPDYTTGYVSTKSHYIRISPLKPLGLNKGGRVYFVQNNTDINELYRFLTEKPVLIKEIDL